MDGHLERWRYALERRGMKVSHNKTEYICVNQRNPSGMARLPGAEMKKVEDFKYLGSTVQSSKEDGDEVMNLEWWRQVAQVEKSVRCDKRVSAKMKGKVHKRVVRPATLHG